MTNEQRVLLEKIIPGIENNDPDTDTIDVDFLGRVCVAASATLGIFLIRRSPDVATAKRASDIWENMIEIWGYAKRTKLLETMPYDDYLATPEWQARAAEVKLLRGNRCEKCGSRDNLHAHHLTYDRRGHELPSDLQVLCKDCHAREHGRAAAAV